MENPGRPLDDELPMAFRGWIKRLYSWVRSRFNIVSVTTTYTVPEEVYLVLADATGGAFTVTIPNATNSRLGREIIIKRLNAGGNAVTLGVTLDGAVNPTLAAQYAYKRIISNGTSWYDVT